MTHIILAAAEVLWHLELFFSHHTIHTHTHTHTRALVAIEQLYRFCFYVVIGETRHHAQTHCTFVTFVFSGLSLSLLWTNAAVDIVFVFCWPMLVMVAVQPVKHLLQPHLAFQPNWGWGDNGFFQLSRSNSSPEVVWNLCGYI